MEKKVRRTNLRMDAFRTKLPLVATLGASLLMMPSMSCAHTGPLKQRQAITRVRKDKVRKLVKELKGDDIRKAVKAAEALVKKGGQAIPSMLKLLDEERKLAARALFVLHGIDWTKVHSSQKELVASRMGPLLMKLEDGKRSPESYFAQAILIKMRDEGLPAFTKLLSSESALHRLLGLAALDDVEWQWISFKATRPVMDALRKMEKDEVELLRQLAKRIIRKISRTFMTCDSRGPGAGDRKHQNPRPETGNRRQETAAQEQDYALAA